MESRNHYKGLPPYAIGTVRHHARRLANSSGFLPADVEDIEQEMMLHLHRQMPRHDASRASANTFMDRLIANHTVSLFRLAQVNKGTFRQVSFDNTENISADHSFWSTPALTWHEVIDTQVDVARFMKRLPPSLRKIAHLLMWEQVSTVARITGLSRQAIYQAIYRMRRLFEETSKKIPTTLQSAAYVRDME